MRENREALQTPTARWRGGTGEEGKSRNVDMYVCREPDGLVVPAKRANKVRICVRRGVRRGKEADQGECTKPLEPDTEPGMRVKGLRR